jgi:hypothetical protein
MSTALRMRRMRPGAGTCVLGSERGVGPFLTRLEATGLLHGLDRTLEALSDCLPHPRRAHTGQVLRLTSHPASDSALAQCWQNVRMKNLCVGFRRADHHDFFSLSLLDCGLTLAARSVDFIHSCQHRAVRLHVCHLRVWSPTKVIHMSGCHQGKGWHTHQRAIDEQSVWLHGLC